MNSDFKLINGLNIYKLNNERVEIVFQKSINLFYPIPLIFTVKEFD